MTDEATAQTTDDTAGPTTDADEASTGALLVLTATELEVLEVAHRSGLVDHRPSAAGPGGGGGGGGDGDPGDDAVGGTGAAWLEAIASLSGRGLVGSDGRLEEATAAGQLAQTVLDVRLGADAMVVVERLLQADDRGPRRQPGPRRDLRVLHLLPVGAVVEDVHAEGLHGFDLVLDPDDLVGAVTDVLVPPDAVAGPGARPDPDPDPVPDPGVGVVAGEATPPQVVEIDPDRADQVAALLGHPAVLAELTLATADGRREGHLVALGPGGCWAAARRPGALRFVPVTPDWVARTVGEWVAGVATDGPG